MTPLGDAFLTTYGGSAPASEARRSLDEALLQIVDGGRSAWPDVLIDPELVARYVGERVPNDAEVVASVRGLRGRDLVLACACFHGSPQALRAFDDAFLAKVPLFLSRLRLTPELVAETRQQLAEKLFVGGDDRLPKIALYGGRGDLHGWVRVAALRTALNLQAREAQPDSLQTDEADHLAVAVAPECDPELAFVRAAFVEAFKEALAALPRRDRAILRFSFVEHLTPARIGAMYGVHRTTVMRWIDAAQEDVLASTRGKLMDRLRLSPSECDSVLAMVKSRAQITLSSLLRTAS
jgi:RNA polymerase sigma-70 factor, ECF subfamily